MAIDSVYFVECIKSKNDVCWMYINGSFKFKKRFQKRAEFYFVLIPT